MKSTVYSFDIFDTVLTRIWARPTDLFWELGKRLQQANLITISCDTWMALRVAAEQAARQESATGEITLQEIYAQVKRQLGLSEAQTQTAIALEIQLEQESLRPVPQNQQAIAALHAANQSVTYLSDMYLPHDAIRGFLKDHQIWAEGDRLYVSGDEGINKVSGKLFQHLLQVRSLQPHQLHHTGDNLHSDIGVAKKLGIQTQPFLESHLNRYETLIINNEQLPLRFRSLLAGASRLARLHCPESDLHHQTIWNTAANVIAPVFFGFIYYVLQESKRLGIRRLYFMARDGHILYKIAQIICREWNYDIECRYFYGSRQAFHFPAIQEIGEAEAKWLFDRPEFLSVRVVCTRANLEPEQIGEVLARYGLPVERWDQNLTDSEFAAVKAAFQDPEILDHVIAQAVIYRQKALGYFQQEGVGDGVPFATVDTGWTGKTQRSFNKILEIGNIYPANGSYAFFFGLTQWNRAFSTDRLMPYFLEPNTVSERYYLCDSQILELFLTADHGSTVRYEQDGDRFVPVLRSEKNESALRWGVTVQHEAVLAFTKQLTQNLRPEDCDVKYFHRMTEDVLGAFLFTPSKAEANTFGTQEFSQHQSESKFYDLAPVYTWRDGIKILLNSKHVHSFAWIPASIQRSSPLARLPLQYVRGLRFSFNYVEFAWGALNFCGDYNLSRDFLRKAVRMFPPILLSRSFLRLTLILLLRPRLKSETYTRLRQLFQSVLRTGT